MLVGAQLLQHSQSHWIKHLEAARVPYGPINNMEQVFEDPHIQARHMVQEVSHPSAGTIPLLSPPIRFDGQQSPIRMAPPTLGQHTDRVLQQELHLTADQLKSLREAKIIR